MRYKVLTSRIKGPIKLSFWFDPILGHYFFEIHYMASGSSFLLLKSITYENYFFTMLDGSLVALAVEQKFLNVACAPQFASCPPSYSKHALNYVSITINDKYFQALEFRKDTARLVRNYVVPKHGRVDYTRQYRKIENKRLNLPRDFERKNAAATCWANFTFELPTICK